MIEYIHFDDTVKECRNFTKEDIKFMSDGNGLQKSNEILTRIGYDIPIFMNIRNHDQHIINQDIEYHERTLSRSLPTPCFVLASNFTSNMNWMPFTAWIIVHRHHHSLFFMRHKDVIVDDYVRNHMTAIQHIMEMDVEITNLMKYYDIRYPTERTNFTNHRELDTVLFSNRVLTTNAGRHANVNESVMDVVAELYAQFVFKGDIAFSDPIDWKFPTNWKFNMYNLENLIKKHDELTEIMERYRLKIKEGLERDYQFLMSSRVCL